MKTSISFAGNALSCKETFSLLYYEFDAATREPPPWDAERYKLIGKFSVYIKIINNTAFPVIFFLSIRIPIGFYNRNWLGVIK